MGTAWYDTGLGRRRSWVQIPPAPPELNRLPKELKVTFGVVDSNTSIANSSRDFETTRTFGENVRGGRECQGLKEATTAAAFSFSFGPEVP